MTFKTTALALALGLVAAPAFAQTSGQTLPGVPELSTLPTSGGGQQLTGLVSVNLGSIPRRDRQGSRHRLAERADHPPASRRRRGERLRRRCGRSGRWAVWLRHAGMQRHQTTIATQYVTNSQTAAGDAASAPIEQPVGNATDADRTDIATEDQVAPQPTGSDVGVEAPGTEAPVTDVAPTDQPEESTAPESDMTGASAPTDTEASTETEASGEAAASGEADAQGNTSTAN